MSNAGNALSRAYYSGTVGRVQFSVRAVSSARAVMSFGVQADNYDLARLAALDRLPWQPETLEVAPEHRHQAGHDDCKLCG